MQDRNGVAAIASVAEHFLTDVRQDQQRQAPRRIKPNGHSHPPPPQQADQPEKADPPNYPFSGTPGRNDAVADRRVEITTVLSGHLRWEGSKGLVEFARHLAGPEKAVGVLKIEATAVQLRVFYHKNLGDKFARLMGGQPGDQEYSEDSGEDSGLVFGGGRDISELTSLLEKLIPHLDYLLTAPAENGGEELRNPGGGTVCILAHPQEEYLVRSYQAVKSLAGREDVERMGAFVTQARDEQEARGVFERLNKTACDFAGIELMNFGYTLADQAVNQELVCRTDFSGQTDQFREYVANLQTYLCELEELCGVDQSDQAVEEAEQGSGEEGEVREEMDEDERAELCAGGVELCDDCDEDSGSAESEGQEGMTDGRGTDGRELLQIDLSQFNNNGNNGSARELTRHIVSLLNSSARIHDDHFSQFLANCGLKCCKTSLSGVQSLIVLIRDNADVQTAAWAFANYPESQQKLYLITAVPIETNLSRVWGRKFGAMTVLNALEGRLDERSMLVIQR